MPPAQPSRRAILKSAWRAASACLAGSALALPGIGRAQAGYPSRVVKLMVALVIPNLEA